MYFSSYNFKNAIFLDSQVITKIINEWLVLAFETWNEKSKPCTNVSIFTIKLIGIISENEKSFDSLNQHHIQEKACQLFEFNENNLSASLKMAFVTMLSSIIEHCSGQCWVEKTGKSLN